MLQRAGKRANAEQKNEVLHVYVCGSNIKHCASGTAAVVSHFFFYFFFFPFLFFALEHTLTLFRHNTHAATHTTHGFPQNRLSQIIISYSRIHVRAHTHFPSHTDTKSCPHSWPSSVRHLRKSSFRASGLIWFLMPPSRLEVASEATIKGRTTVGGICRRTPPTAPGRPFCSWPRDATSHNCWAVSITPWRAKRADSLV